MVYQWKVPLYKVPAQTAGEYIEGLERANGFVTAKMLVDESRPVGATLHSCYEWDDEKAAEKYREGQSKTLLSNLVTVKISNTDEDMPVPNTRAFVSVSSGKETASYISTVRALSDEATKKTVLENARAELKAFKVKYEGLIDLAELLNEMLKEVQP